MRSRPARGTRVGCAKQERKRSAGSAKAFRNLKRNFTVSLAAHIRSKGKETNQVHRFLVTADWLRRRGSGVLSTASVSKALSDNHQSKLTNPAECLNKNVSKGFCEKNKDGFFITPEGLKELGTT